MVSSLVRDSYFNNKLIQTRDSVLMNSEYGSPGSFVSIFRSKSNGNTYIHVEEVISVQNRRKYMEQFINLI